MSKTQKTNKPLYRVTLGKDKGYYSANIAWRGCTKEEADLFTHKQAVLIMNHLFSLHYSPSLELSET